MHDFFAAYVIATSDVRHVLSITLWPHLDSPRWNSGPKDSRLIPLANLAVRRTKSKPEMRLLATLFISVLWQRASNEGKKAICDYRRILNDTTSQHYLYVF